MQQDNKHKFILFTDIDGTLLNQEKIISRQNIEALSNAHQIIRVAISGRNLISARRVLPPDIPIDYLVFSNGAGILDWHNGEIIYSRNMALKIARTIAQHLIDLGITFTVHRPVPQTHYYLYHIGSYTPQDLPMRNSYYMEYTDQLEFIEQIGNSTCIICMLEPDEKQFFWLKDRLLPYKDKISITRTTSPFTHSNIWLEIYDNQVSKGQTATRLCQMLGIDPGYTIGIGNDYNDLSLLEFVHYPFVVDNAPDELKKRFTSTTDHNNHAIAEVISFIYKELL